jgi:hypothetical protein
MQTSNTNISISAGVEFTPAPPTISLRPRCFHLGRVVLTDY